MQTETWTELARSLVSSGRRPHFAPSEEILAIVRQRLSAFVSGCDGDCRAVILGATPELADLALRAGCRVVRIDSNPAMFEAAARRESVADRSMETIVLGNWMQMDEVGDGEADIVLGDSSLNNVAHDDMSRQLAELARITHPAGMLLLRQIVMPDRPHPDYDFTPTLTAYRAGDITADDFHRRLRFYSFTPEAYDPLRRVLDAGRVFAAIGRQHDAGVLTEAEFAFLQDRRSEIRHTVYGLAEQRRLLETLGSCEVIPGGQADSARDLFKVFEVRVGRLRA